MSKQNVSLIGAGGMASEIISILAHEYNIDYLYDNTIKQDTWIHGHPASKTLKKENEHIISVGYPSTKVKILETIKHDVIWAEALRHHLTYLGGNVDVGKGSILYPFVTLTRNIVIEELATINSNVTIGHDCLIGKMFHACAGATVSGSTIIGDRVFLGANACIKENLTVCNDVIIGAGAVVVRNILRPGKYAGKPARLII